MEYKFSRFQSPVGKLRKPTPAQHIEQTISEFVSELSSRFREQSERDPAGFKKQVVKLIRRHLPPRPGRPNDPRIDAAVRMVGQGKTVKDVLRLQIRGSTAWIPTDVTWPKKAYGQRSHEGSDEPLKAICNLILLDFPSSETRPNYVARRQQPAIHTLWT